eukprot:4273695-Prymnesium_polylepis.2
MCVRANAVNTRLDILCISDIWNLPEDNNSTHLRSAHLAFPIACLSGGWSAAAHMPPRDHTATSETVTDGSQSAHADEHGLGALPWYGARPEVARNGRYAGSTLCAVAPRLPEREPELARLTSICALDPLACPPPCGPSSCVPSAFAGCPTSRRIHGGQLIQPSACTSTTTW